MKQPLFLLLGSALSCSPNYVCRSLLSQLWHCIRHFLNEVWLKDIFIYISNVHHSYDSNNRKVFFQWQMLLFSYWGRFKDVLKLFMNNILFCRLLKKKLHSFLPLQKWHLSPSCHEWPLLTVGSLHTLLTWDVCYLQLPYLSDCRQCASATLWVTLRYTSPLCLYHKVSQPN